MAWETAVDRLLINEVHKAERGDVRKDEVTRQLRDFWTLTAPRPESAFVLGYARVLLGTDVEPDGGSGDEAERAWRWHDFGRLRGHDRLGERNWVADLVQNPERLMGLLHEPAIASQCLPLAMRSMFYSGDFELAVQAIGYLDTTSAGREGRLIVDAALTDLLTRLERRTPQDREVSNLSILHKAVEMPAWASLPEDVRARYHRAVGTELLRISEYEQALVELGKGFELADDRMRVRSNIALLCALVCLRQQDVLCLEPRAERVGRDEAATWLDRATEQPGEAVPEAFYVQGILAYEMGDHERAADQLDTALGGLRRAERDARLIHRAGFFLASCDLSTGNVDQAPRALRLIETALGEVTPDLDTFYDVFEAIKHHDARLALTFLDAVDLGRGTQPEQLLLIALEYIGLGEAGPAATAAKRVLAIATDLDQRIEAMRVLLTAGNMQGDHESTRRVFEDMRDLLMRRGAFDDLEKLLQDEDVVGQALDHFEIKLELIALYEEMDERDAERATLQTQVARSLRARKDVDSLLQAQALLTEVEVHFPDLAKDDLAAIEKLLALEGASMPTEGGAQVVAELTERLGRAPRVLVVGGNERQRRHHSRLEELCGSWGCDGEWLMANYTSPQRVVSTIGERIDHGLDLLVLLHWNRHETTEPALELARKAGVAARTVHYAGFTSLETALLEMLTKQSAAGDEELVATPASGKKRKSR